ncbi:MAG TPA: FAD-dependent oxidoreductase [Stenomitos sp.]
MAVAYDLVVVGATTAAKTAAIAAAEFHARVAWAPSTPVTCDPLLLLREAARTKPIQGADPALTPADWVRWASVLQSTLENAHSPAAVQTYGVDYWTGEVTYNRNAFTVEGRDLRSRAYLLAMPPEPSLPEALDIGHPHVWSIAQLWSALCSTPQQWPTSVAVWGNSVPAVELSQSLRRLGRSVILLTGGEPLLPHEDRDLAFLLQAFLEGDGILVDTDSPIQLQSAPADRLVLKGSAGSYTVDAVVSADGAWRLPPGLAALNLQQSSQGIDTNRALQTSVPHIYACGSLLGGYPLPSLACQEAKHAVHNALFEQHRPMQYWQMPYCILSQPALARVGLTEQQARQFDPGVQVLRQTYQTCDRALINQSPAGLCKVLVQADGRLLGAHLLGEAAAEIIHLFALAIQQGIPLQALSDLGYAAPVFTQVVQGIAAQWQRQQYRRDRNERWFYKRRRRTQPPHL